MIKLKREMIKLAKVFLGVGHGGRDPGAIGNGYKESFLNLEIAKACRDVLKAHGVTVKMSREKDENDTLEQEIKEAIAFKPTLAVDIHCNAGGGDGFEAAATRVALNLFNLLGGDFFSTHFQMPPFISSNASYPAHAPLRK